MRSINIVGSILAAAALVVSSGAALAHGHGGSGHGGGGGVHFGGGGGARFSGGGGGVHFSAPRSSFRSVGPRVAFAPAFSGHHRHHRHGFPVGFYSDYGNYYYDNYAYDDDDVVCYYSRRYGREICRPS